MSSKWDAAKEAAKKAGGGRYVRLQNDGDKVVGAFVGEPNPREFYYDEKEKKTYPYTEEHKKAGKRSSLKIGINFFIFSENGTAANRMAVYEMGPALFKDLLKVREKYGLEKWAFEIERHGAKGDTKTTYSILPEEQLTTEQRKAISEAKLFDLDKEDDGNGEGGNGNQLGDYEKPTDENAAIDADTAAVIVGRLKVLAKEKRDDFLKKFSIGKVKELPAKRVKEALAYVAELDGPSSDSSDDTFE